MKLSREERRDVMRSLMAAGTRMMANPDDVRLIALDLIRPLTRDGGLDSYIDQVEVTVDGLLLLLDAFVGLTAELSPIGREELWRTAAITLEQRWTEE